MSDMGPREADRVTATESVACPSCTSTDIATYLWGMPAFDRELERDIDAGRVVLGGCVVTGEDPTHRCNACGREFLVGWSMSSTKGDSRLP